jgi:hypothetical protein
MAPTYFRTRIAPVSPVEMETDFYAGAPSTPTIQAAVTRAAGAGVPARVIIPIDYAGSDAITAVTGGVDNVFLLDLRNAQWQAYHWDDSLLQYVPASFVQNGWFGSRQVNFSLFVGSASWQYNTIQGALDFAAGFPSFAYAIVIGPSYNAGEDISTLTNGRSNIYLVDQRGAAWVNYTWYAPNNQYVPAPINATAGLSVSLINHYMYVWNGGKYKLIQTAINDAITFTGNWCILVGPSYNGGEDIANLAGTANAYIVDQRAAEWAWWEWNGTNYVNVSNSVGGDLHVSGDIYANNAILSGMLTVAGKSHLTGTVTADNDVLVGGSLQTTGLNVEQNMMVNGNAQISGTATIGGTATLNGVHATGPVTFDGNLSAQAGTFTSCQVSNSPVRTFANTPDGPGQGMVWPPTGIPVSQGSTWQNPSIDPTSLATWPAAGIPVSTGTAWGSPINPNTLATYPAAGVAVSTGTAWGSSIPSANVVVKGTGGLVSGIGLEATGTMPANTATQSAVRAGISGTFPILSWTNSGAPADARIYDLLVDTSGNLLGRMVNDSGSPTNWLIVSRTGNTPTTATIAADVQANGKLQAGSALTMYTYAGSFAAAGQATCRVNTTGDMSFSPGYTNTGLDFGIDSTFQTDKSGVYRFWSGNGGSGNNAILTIDRAGNLSATGGITASSKSFKIPHPTDPTKYLIHGSLEGPEYGVYYRGEGETANGKATITLPDYFEALTMPDQRTIQLTVRVDDDNPVFGGQLAAGRVKDGKFTVYSTDPAAKFYWEVKAVRRDIGALDVEPAKTAAETLQ